MTCLTDQEIFDKVRDHLLEQGEKAEYVDQFGSSECFYRTDSGLKCAVGCLIPDELYERGAEGHGVGYLYDKGFLPDVDESSIYILEELQAFHDTVPAHEWPVGLPIFAKSHGLEP